VKFEPDRRVLWDPGEAVPVAHELRVEASPRGPSPRLSPGVEQEPDAVRMDETATRDHQVPKANA
jgi:hypothetical protein